MNPPYLFLSIAAVSVCSFTAVVIWVKERRREREAYYSSETVKKIAALQGPNVNAAVEFFRDAERNGRSDDWRGSRWEACLQSQLDSAWAYFYEQ
jgi:hypothetical protein